MRIIIYKAACLFTAIALCVTVSGHDARAASLEVSMPGDVGMSCSQIEREVFIMENLILRTWETQDKSRKARMGVGVVKTVGSYLIGSLGGAVGIMAAGHLANRAASGEAEDAAVIEDIAKQRRSLMIGMHQVKGCAALPPSLLDEALMERAAQDPADIEPAAGSTHTMSHKENDRYNG